MAEQKHFTDNQRAFVEKLLEVSRRKDLTIETEESHKGYTALHFKFDFGVDKFESFVLFYHEDNSGGSDGDDFEQLVGDVDEIIAKADRIKER